MNKKYRYGMIIGILFLLVASLAAGFLLARFAPGASNLERRFSVYVEGFEPSGRLVVLSSRQRFHASREFTTRLLALIRLDASIDLTVLAEVSYCVDLSDPSALRIRWDPVSRRLDVRVPEPSILPPAVMTETVEIREQGSNLLTEALFGLKRELRSMLGALSGDIMSRCEATLDDPAIRARIRLELER